MKDRLDATTELRNVHESTSQRLSTQLPNYQAMSLVNLTSKWMFSKDNLSTRKRETFWD